MGITIVSPSTLFSSLDENVEVFCPFFKENSRRPLSCSLKLQATDIILVVTVAGSHPA